MTDAKAKDEILRIVDWTTYASDVASLINIDLDRCVRLYQELDKEGFIKIEWTAGGPYAIFTHKGRDFLKSGGFVAQEASQAHERAQQQAEKQWNKRNQNWTVWTAIGALIVSIVGVLVPLLTTNEEDDKMVEHEQRIEVLENKLNHLDSLRKAIEKAEFKETAPR